MDSPVLRPRLGKYNPPNMPQWEPEATYKTYDKTTFYILDACDEPAESADNQDIIIKSEHYQKQKAMRAIFSTYFDQSKSKIEDVQFSRGTKVDKVIEYFETKLSTKTSKDLTVLYFHGGGGGNGEDYAWKFSHGYPKKEIDAYELIKTVTESGKDTLLLLDCYIPDRFADKWATGTGLVEIVATGQPLQHTDGTTVELDSGDFTKSILRNFNKFTEKMAKCTSKKPRMPKTIPQMLARDKNMSSNTRRVPLRVEKDSNGHPISRHFVFQPDLVKEDGHLEFFLEEKRYVRVETAEEQAEEAEEQLQKESEDEGIQDMDVSSRDDNVVQGADGSSTEDELPDADTSI